MNADVLTTRVADGIAVITLGSAKCIYFDEEMGDALTESLHDPNLLAPVRECTRMAAKAMHQGPIWAAPGILRRRRAQARRSAIRSAAPLQNIVLPSAPST